MQISNFLTILKQFQRLKRNIIKRKQIQKFSLSAPKLAAMTSILQKNYHNQKKEGILKFNHAPKFQIKSWHQGIQIQKELRTCIGLGPYLNSTPRNWFFRTTGPAWSPAPAEMELLPIFKLLDRSVLPRTMPESQEPVDEEDVDDEEDDDEVEDDSDRFISDGRIHMSKRPGPQSSYEFPSLTWLSPKYVFMSDAEPEGV